MDSELADPVNYLAIRDLQIENRVLNKIVSMVEREAELERKEQNARTKR
jgi:hypothetical protein